MHFSLSGPRGKVSVAPGYPVSVLEYPLPTNSACPFTDDTDGFSADRLLTVISGRRQRARSSCGSSAGVSEHIGKRSSPGSFLPVSRCSALIFRLSSFRVRASPSPGGATKMPDESDPNQLPNESSRVPRQLLHFPRNPMPGAHRTETGPAPMVEQSPSLCSWLSRIPCCVG